MARGGKRDNAGRPKGSLSKTTKERLEKEKVLHTRILGAVDRLFNSQFALAQGVTHLFRIQETGEGKNKRREHILVTNPEEIKQYLDELEGGSGKIDGSEDYYYMTTKVPDNKAIDSMLDRVFGKALVKTQMLDDDGEVVAPTTNVNIINASKDELLRILTGKSADNTRRGK